MLFTLYYDSVLEASYDCAPKLFPRMRTSEKKENGASPEKIFPKMQLLPTNKTTASVIGET